MLKRSLRLALLLILAEATLLPAFGTETPQREIDPAVIEAPRVRPRLALVLSGGGARGAAHIGVIRVLEKLHVHPDLIVGTSMGSIVGGLYATGWSPDEIEKVLNDIKWNELFFDSVARGDKSYRRKRDDDIYLIQAKLRFKGWKPQLPRGMVSGQGLELMLKSLEFQSTSASDFDDFPIPFRAVAADISTGEAVVLGKGSLATAMRASMSVWGAFPPVEIEGKMLVDGGAVANLPVGIAQQLGAERIIAVDITSPLSEKEEMNSFISIVSQASGFLTVGNRVEDVKRLRPGDVLIVPQLGDLGFAEFKRAAEAVEIGEAAARAAEPELRAFSTSEDDWAEFRAHHQRQPESDVRLDEVHLDNSSWVDDEVVRRRIEIPTGGPLDLEAVRRGVRRLQALDYFGLIQMDLVSENGGGVLTLQTPKKPYSRNSLQFGVAFVHDFQGEATYSFTARHLFLAANRWGGEWQNVLQIGSTSAAATEFYQPLDRGMRFFVAPGGAYRDWHQSIWVDGNEVADYRIKASEARLDVGRVFERWGEIRLGVFSEAVSGSVRIGDPESPGFSSHNSGARLSFKVDTLDSVAFARHGSFVKALYGRSFGSLDSDVPFSQVSVQAGKAFSFGKNTIYPSFELLTNLETPVTLDVAYTLGGFLRLSGLGMNELIGEQGGVARALYYRQLSRLDLGALSSRIYVGLSLEAGNVYQEKDAVTWGSLRTGGSIFLGAETVLGPAYIAWGRTEGGRSRVYLTIGQQF